MAVLIATGGGVQTRIIDSGRDYTQDELERMAAISTKAWRGAALNRRGRGSKMRSRKSAPGTTVSFTPR